MKNPINRRTALKGVVASVVFGVITAMPASAATVQRVLWDDWRGKNLYLKAQTFYAPYVSNGVTYYKVYDRYWAEGSTSGGRYNVSSGRGKLSTATSWVGLPVGNFKYVGTIRASQYGTVKVDTHVYVYDYYYNSGKWYALPRTV